MRYFTLGAMTKTMQSDLVEKAKVTSVKMFDWNSMEGQNYQINIRLITVDGYKNKLVAILTNSTYLEEWNALEQSLEEYIEELLNSQEKLSKVA